LDDPGDCATLKTMEWPKKLGSVMMEVEDIALDDIAL
jgi:hypothetical protein